MSEHPDQRVPDHDSDPARTPGDGWVGEGGASHLGPATHVRAGRPEDEDEAAEDDAADTASAADSAAE
ncbi:hypothetical protein [Leucobacter luti]|uniref:Uncharacterized protein n=1 Tax=Leucobacter luti TaxID=340320 RepID=A0A4Q7U140_9MICO|nr:hypothetical protein [Leucobacter luti]MBL3699582.1 hypothetical protein [Leucobacter luti]RZT67094.1 hypothetical protein EV139_1228 [Leucobacter luti]